MALQLELATPARRDDILLLFTEYTKAILAEGEQVRLCLEAQHYDGEARDPLKKYAPDVLSASDGS